MRYILLRFAIYWFVIAVIYAGVSWTLDRILGVVTMDSIRMIIFSTIFGGLLAIKDAIETADSEIKQVKNGN